MKTIDITQRHRPVMETVDGGEPQPSGPLEVAAKAEIVRACARCRVTTSRTVRPVTVKSEGQWWGTTVHDAETGARVCETWSVSITIPDEGEATAVVKAYHANEK